MNKSIRTALATTAIIATAGITALVGFGGGAVVPVPETGRVAATPPPDSLLGIYGSEDALHDAINAGLAADTWTPAPAPATLLDYESSLASMRTLWDGYSQPMRDSSCADWGAVEGMFGKHFEGVYDLKAVADFGAQVCAP